MFGRIITRNLQNLSKNNQKSNSSSWDMVVSFLGLTGGGFVIFDKF